MAFNIPVNTPNGLGYAFGQMPDGKIMVSHGWKDLTDEFKAQYEREKGHKASVVIQTYKLEEVEEVYEHYGGKIPRKARRRKR